MMVKQTQKLMVAMATALLLLLSFGLGFYSYPLVAPIDGGTAIDADSSMAAGDGDLGAASDDEIDSATATGVAQLSTEQDDNGTDAAASASLGAAEIELAGVEADDIALFLDAWQALDEDFFGEEPPSRQRMYGAIRGLLQAYDDPYTFFIEPETNEVEQGNLRGSFGGIGAHVQPSEVGFVLDPMRGNPAEASGIERGDVLVRIDETDINVDTPIDDVIALIRGPLDTDVLLGLLRRADIEDLSPEALDGAESVTVTVTRGEIKTPSMEWRLITGDGIPVDDLLKLLSGEQDVPESDSDAEPDAQLPTEPDSEAWQSTKIGYIQHRIYSDRSPSEMQTAIDELLAQGADRFIIDLRGNPGGPVTAVVKVTDLWTSDSPIMLEEKADGSERRFEATSDVAVGDEPIVIVVDGGTASASEIFAGALRDHGRAEIVGEQTFGKGSVQVIHVLPDSSSMHITNALWFTPDGHRINGVGLTPDYVVKPGTDSLHYAILQLLGESPNSGLEQ